MCEQRLSLTGSERGRMIGFPGKIPASILAGEWSLVDQDCACCGPQPITITALGDPKRHHDDAFQITFSSINVTKAYTRLGATNNFSNPPFVCISIAPWRTCIVL